MVKTSDYFNLDEIKPLLDAGTYSQLPAPLCPKEAEVDVPMTINYNIQQGDDDNYVIVKMITFLRAPKMSLMKNIIQGTGYAIDHVPDRFGRGVDVDLGNGPRTVGESNRVTRPLLYSGLPWNSSLCCMKYSIRGNP